MTVLELFEQCAAWLAEGHADIEVLVPSHVVAGRVETLTSARLVVERAVMVPTFADPPQALVFGRKVLLSS